MLRGMPDDTDIPAQPRVAFSPLRDLLPTLIFTAVALGVFGTIVILIGLSAGAAGGCGGG
jgi:hypothetical protein